MKKLFTFWALAMCLSLWAQDKKITFAVLSDTHLGSFAYALDDLEKAIADINANPDIDLVIISGDITEFGTDGEIMGLRKSFRRLPRNTFSCRATTIPTGAKAVAPRSIR